MLRQAGIASVLPLPNLPRHSQVPSCLKAFIKARFFSLQPQSSYSSNKRTISINLRQSFTLTETSTLKQFFAQSIPNYQPSRWNQYQQSRSSLASHRRQALLAALVALETVAGASVLQSQRTPPEIQSTGIKQPKQSQPNKNTFCLVQSLRNLQ